MKDEELYLVPVNEDLMPLVEVLKEFTDEEKEYILEFIKALACEPEDYLPC